MEYFVTAKSKKLNTLLKDFGYKFHGGLVFSLGIRGFTSTRAMFKARDVFDAAELLIPIIADEEFRQRYTEITKYE